MNAKGQRFLRSIGSFVWLGALVQPVAADVPMTPAHIHRYILFAKSEADYDKAREHAVNSGARIFSDMRQGRALVVTAPSESQAQLQKSSHVQRVVKDHVIHLIEPRLAEEMGFNRSASRVRIDMGHPAVGASSSPTPDPAFGLPGLMWNVRRIDGVKAWNVTTGNPTVLVGVADTGLDYTHSELGPRVASVQDFTDSLCKDYFGSSDADNAALYGGPEDTDWNGHGTWIGGNIAGTLDGVGMNGIAPNITLVALKIAQWCGSTWDSTILDAFYYAADNNIDIVSISFGGYLDRSDPDQDAIYTAYVDAVAYARAKGTLIIASAGNEHVRIGRGGQVISHGPLTTPGDPFVDYYGLWEVPGGIPGVVDVSATGNVVAAPSPACEPEQVGADATCKPLSDAHQPIGVGRKNQLTYYSNYGSRIDLAAPGGARKFNLPRADRGGTGGWPITTADGYAAFEDFSITSNWALEIPCFVNIGPQFYPDECYSTIQGTSMATPHVSAVAALIASQRIDAQHNPARLAYYLKLSAKRIHGNATPPLSATDVSAGDLTGVACDSGYCHLGGWPIADRDAYGAGLVDADAVVRMFGL